MIPRRLLLLAGIACASLRVWAGDAVFSRDGGHVFTLREEHALEDLDLTTKSASIIPLGKSLGQARLVALSRAPDGRLLVATEHAIWACDPGKRTCVRLCAAPASTVIFDLACDLKTEAIVFTTRLAKGERDDWTLFALKKGSPHPIRVVTRRLDGVFEPVFDADGTLFFGTHGDLWSGRIDWEDDPERPDLIAERCAPLATLETQNTTPLEMGVHAIAIAGETLYLHVSRMGGSGHGTVVRMKKPRSATAAQPQVTEKKGEEFRADRYLKETLAGYLDLLRSVEPLNESSLGADLCASADGSKVYFRQDGENPDCLIAGGKRENLKFSRKNEP